MTFRLSWLLSIFIYLSVNGNLFAVPVHLCQSMAASVVTSLAPSETLKIHEHHGEHTEQGINNFIEDEHNMKMDNCSCVDCDCTINNIGQVSVSLITQVELTSYIPNIPISITIKEQSFISQPQSNPLRPPITC